MKLIFLMLQIVLLFLALINQSFAESAYNQKLPANIDSDPDLCNLINCKAVIPEATSFSKRKGNPTYVEAYVKKEGNQELIGYVFLSTDIDDTVGYSGKPIVTLMGIDNKGKIVGIKVLKHSEPILLAGIPENDFIKFLNQYIGHFANTNFEIGKGESVEGNIDLVSGATVTVIAQNQLISRSLYAVARQVGLVQEVERPQAILIDSDKKLSWNDLIKKNAISHILVKSSDLGIEGDNRDFIDLYYGYLNAPEIGKSILGDREYKNLMSSLHENEHAIFVVSNGLGSFKGSGFVRGGIYDRIQIKQEHDIFTFKDADYMNLYSNSASGAPRFKEKAIFIIKGKNFSAAYPWKFIFLANKEDKQTREKSFISFESTYWLPDGYLKGGRPHIELAQPPWKKIWKNQAVGIIIFCLWIVFVLCFFITRDKWVRLSDRKNKGPVFWPKQISWIFAFVFVGFYKMAQPSITQVLTIFHTPISGWNWELFLIDPYIFIFWLVIIITTFIWGRGLFCGWMCPFGSLSEFIFKIAKKTRLSKFQFFPNSKFHHIFKWLKHIIFFGLVIVSLYSMSLAERLAEVEPFKTTFLVGIWNRSWPYVLFVIVILAISILMERPFCKYLCPLGAGLAIPSRFNILKLRRKPGCTTCKACAKGCGALAIDEKGRIDSKECLLCLDCMVMYYDMNSCPPLAKEKKRRQKSNLPLTAIDGTGHFIPIYNETQLKNDLL